MCQQGPTWAPWMDSKPEQKPAREWVGLTDEEIRMLIPPDNGWKYEIGYGEAIEFARAIEAKLREKNNG